MFDLTGKVALVTGSTRGIGKAIAKGFAGAGAKVVVSSRKTEACALVAAEIGADGGEALPIPANVSDRGDLEQLVGATLEAWGHIDALVCNAAINPYFGPLAEIGDDAYDAIMETNVKNTLWLCNRVIKTMAGRGGGSVIVVSSIGAFKGTKNLGAYGMSKAANLQIVKSLAVEWGHSGIRINGIAPGLVKTDMARELWENPETYAKAVEAYPLGRLGEPEDMVGPALLLASDAGAFITGQTLIVDGGSTAAGGQYV